MFLDDEIVAMYDDFMEGNISHKELMDKHGKAVAEFLHKTPTLTNLKRLVNSINLSVDRVMKKYGRSLSKKISYNELYAEIFNKK